MEHVGLELLTMHALLGTVSAKRLRITDNSLGSETNTLPGFLVAVDNGIRDPFYAAAKELAHGGPQDMCLLTTLKDEVHARPAGAHGITVQALPLVLPLCLKPDGQRRVTLPLMLGLDEGAQVPQRCEIHGVPTGTNRLRIGRGTEKVALFPGSKVLVSLKLPVLQEPGEVVEGLLGVGDCSWGQSGSGIPATGPVHVHLLCSPLLEGGGACHVGCDSGGRGGTGRGSSSSSSSGKGGALRSRTHLRLEVPVVCPQSLDCSRTSGEGGTAAVPAETAASRAALQRAAADPVEPSTMQLRLRPRVARGLPRPLRSLLSAAKGWCVVSLEPCVTKAMGLPERAGLSYHACVRLRDEGAVEAPTRRVCVDLHCRVVKFRLSYLQVYAACREYPTQSLHVQQAVCSVK